MNDGMRALRSEHDQLLGWLLDDAFPCWSSFGIDRRNGGFFEKLHPDGTPAEEPRRARVAARQAYAFAIAHKLGWSGPARELMCFALDHLLRRHIDAESGLVIPTISPEGTVLRRDFDLYDHAFVLFGLATAASHGERSAEFDERAARLREDMKAGWAHPIAGFAESRPSREPLKSNPHMHLLEAALAWIEVSDDPAWGSFADELAELALGKFVEPESGAVREYFDGDWERLDEDEFNLVEPGHQFEWAWLLLRWGRLRGRSDAIAAAHRLTTIGETHGVCGTRDLAVNELNPDLTVRSAVSRLWPQTERIKAHALAMAIAETEDDRELAAHRAARASAGLRRFLDHPLRGGWWENIGPNGAPVLEPSRTTSLYHIVGAITELTDRLNSLTPSRVNRI